MLDKEHAVLDRKQLVSENEQAVLDKEHAVLDRKQTATKNKELEKKY